MRQVLLALCMGALVSACATEPNVAQPGTAPSAKKRTSATPSAKRTTEVRSQARAQPNAGAPLDSVVIQHRNRGKPALLAAVGGALERADVENYMAQQQAELQRTLQTEIDQGEMRIERRVSDQTLRINITPDNGFDNLSSVIKPELHASLIKIGPLLNQYNKTLLTIIGYIETNGADAGNQKLAERRAKSVSDLFTNQSVEPLRLQSFARNETSPPADATPLRRIELWIQPIVQ